MVDNQVDNQVMFYEEIYNGISPIVWCLGVSENQDAPTMAIYLRQMIVNQQVEWGTVFSDKP